MHQRGLQRGAGMEAVARAPPGRGAASPHPPGTFTAEHSRPWAPLPRRAVTGTNPAPARDPAGPWEMLEERSLQPCLGTRGAGARPWGQDRTLARPAGSPGARGELRCVTALYIDKLKPLKAAEPLGRVKWLYWGTAPTCPLLPAGRCPGGRQGPEAESPQGTRAALGVHRRCQAEEAEARPG